MQLDLGDAKICAAIADHYERLTATAQGPRWEVQAAPLRDRAIGFRRIQHLIEEGNRGFVRDDLQLVRDHARELDDTEPGQFKGEPVYRIADKILAVLESEHL